jgi:hypothetical protein
MEELKINIPEGYEIDKENSTFECIKFKKIPETIIKWDSLNFAVEVQCKGEHFLVSAKPNMVMNWNDAMRYFNNNLAWKLPTRKQLQIIHEHLEKINNLIEEIGGYKIFGWIWTEEKNGIYAWYVDMYNGNSNFINKNHGYYVRAVSAL